MSEEYPAEYEPTDDVMSPAPPPTVEELVDARLATVRDESAARRRRMEYLKFGILAVILLVIVVGVALAQPLIFDRIVPAVMGGDSSTAGLDETSPADAPANQDTTAPEDNTQNLPIISVPGSDGAGSDGAGTGGEGGEEGATAVPAQTYVVQQGDTLNSIARQFNTTVEAIVAANDIQNPDSLLVGETLIVPQP